MCRNKKRLLVGVATILILCLALMGQAFTVYAVDAVSASQSGSEIPSGGGASQK